MLIYLVILAAVAARFIPHMPNFAPITALAIFSAAQLDWKKAAGITLAARLVSDLFLGFFSWPLMLAVYASHLVGILFGLWIKRQQSWTRIGLSSLASSLLFFLVTNFAFLYAEYPHSLSGIAQSYVNGLPFLRGTLVGDLGYTAALFGALALVKYFASQKAKILSSVRPLS